MVLKVTIVLFFSFSLALTSSGCWAVDIPNGGVCKAAGVDPGPPASWGLLDAQCASQACYPGIAERGVMDGGHKVPWFCASKASHCSVPWSAGTARANGANQDDSVGPGKCTCDPALIKNGRCQPIIPPMQQCKPNESSWQNDSEFTLQVFIAYPPNFTSIRHFTWPARVRLCTRETVFKYCVADDGRTCQPNNHTDKGVALEHQRHETEAQDPY